MRPERMQDVNPATVRDVALMRMVKGSLLIDRAKGDVGSPYFRAGTRELSTAREEAALFGVDMAQLIHDADNKLRTTQSTRRRGW